LSSLLLVPDNSSCCLPVRPVHTVPISILLGIANRARVRGKVPINTDLSACCWSLITAAVACLVHALYTWVPIQYPVRDFATKGLVKQVPINTDLSSLLLVPDNSSCCLPACTRFIHGSQSSILLGISKHGARVRGKVPINIDLSSLLLVPDNSLLPALHAYTWAQSSIP
jgi:hypothetical protein